MSIYIAFLIGYRLGARPPGRSVEKTVMLTFFCRVLKNWPIYTVIGRPGGHRSCFVAMAPRCQAPSFVIDGVRGEMPAEKVEEGDMGRPHRSRQCRLEGQRRGGALLPREGQGWSVTARRRRSASKI